MLERMPTRQGQDEILGVLEKEAAKHFVQSGNCAQGTFSALTAQFGLDDEDEAVFHALVAFPGMAGRGETCGACSAAMLVLGLAFGQQGYGQARLFCERFEQENGSTQCGEIMESNLGRSYRFPEDMAAYLQDGGGQVCLGVIQKAVRIAGQIMLDHQDQA